MLNYEKRLKLANCVCNASRRDKKSHACSSTYLRDHTNRDAWTHIHHIYCQNGL